jgi:hypothetical protein
MGNTSSATGPNAVAIGSASTATGDGTMAFGQGNMAIAQHSIAIGSQNTTSGNYSIAMGSKATAKELGSFVWAGQNKGSKAQWTPYESHGSGTFNVNPIGGLSSFYIGNTSLADTLSGKADISALFKIFDDEGNVISADRTVLQILSGEHQLKDIPYVDQIWHVVGDKNGTPFDTILTCDGENSWTDGTNTLQYLEYYPNDFVWMWNTL